ncbi:MAG: NAD(P)H-dependent oxidoreductase [candidate division WOR-3 bacterium]|nr:NAD(P)H-dependent oxidoreductase [candidate division WOR-3 bacterium]
MLKALVGYYSRTGNTKRMAQAIARGIKKEGLDVDLLPLNKIKPKDLLKYKLIVLGSPTYYGVMAGEMKKFIDESVKYHEQLSGKIGGAFTSCGGIAGGAETTLLSILEAFLIHGMVIMGESGSYHYGPVAIEKPDKKVLTSCELYGHKLARLTKKIFAT